MYASFLWQAVWWLLEWAGIIGLSGLALVVVAKLLCRIAVQTWQKASFELEIILITLVEQASDGLKWLIVSGIYLAINLIFISLRIVFWPLRVLLRKVRKQKPEAPKPPPAMGDPVKEARAILGLPEQFTATDLRSRYLSLMKTVHPDHGVGTDWLAQQVNWAKSVLEKVV
jgi:hypothetical protein